MTRPVSLPSTISSSLAATKSIINSCASGSITCRKPPETIAAVKAQAAQRADAWSAPRGQLDLVGDLVEHLGGQARQRGHPLVQRLGEVQLAAHRGLGDLGDRGLGAGPGGEHLDDLALDQRRVDVEHDEPLGPSRQAVVLERDVDALVDRHPGQRRLQLAVARPPAAPRPAAPAR